MRTSRIVTVDARRKVDPFRKSRVLEIRYARQLRGIAREVGRIVAGHDVGTERAASSIQSTLGEYSKLLRPWAQVTAARLAAALDLQDRATWNRASKEMSRYLRRDLENAPVGDELERFVHDNVDLITSLPTEAADRVQKLTIQGLTDSKRYDEVKREILKTGEVTESRATLIARTETARTASALTQVRAESIGSEAYVWRTAGDSDVRPLHRKLNGKVFHWDAPPVAGENGERANAGQIYNCRCYPEPIVPELE